MYTTGSHNGLVPTNLHAKLVGEIVVDGLGGVYGLFMAYLCVYLRVSVANHD